MRKSFDLYFRLNPPEGFDLPEASLVIARMYFKQQKQGHGTALLNFLAGQAIQFGYKHLILECANENASAFARQLGFHNMRDNHFSISVDDWTRNPRYRAT
jgi:GNAT superfamily N-acetyltransferase